MPQTMMSAAVVPKSFKASETIASLLGTIPCTPNACWNILPNGSRDRTTTSAPALKIKKPNIVLMVPEVIVAAGFSERLNL